MIAPPNEGELISRLEKRGSESREKIRERVKRMDYELSKKNLYDYTVVNDDLEEAVKEIRNIINSAKANS